MREIKFRIIYKGKVSGYERLTETKDSIHWEWVALDMNPDDGRERWVSGCYPRGYKYQREQFSGFKISDKEIYSGDIIEYSIEDLDGNDVVYTEIVEFKDGQFCCETTPLYAIIEWNCALIGNVHQNPELLNQ